MRIVLDTNVVISGLNFDGTERTVLELARFGRYHLFLSPHILQETADVLHRKFEWDDDHIFRAIRALSTTATIVTPTREVTRIPGHPADNQVLATALEAEADFVVTGDRKHLLPLETHLGMRIISAGELYRLLEAD